MRLLEVAFDIFATAIGLAATCFMILTFYFEAFLHHGITFIEPNLTIATSEFFLCVFGLIVMVVLWWRRMIGWDDEKALNRTSDIIIVKDDL